MTLAASATWPTALTSPTPTEPLARPRAGRRRGCRPARAATPGEADRVPAGAVDGRMQGVFAAGWPSGTRRVCHLAARGPLIGILTTVARAVGVRVEQ